MRLADRLADLRVLQRLAARLPGDRARYTKLKDGTTSVVTSASSSTWPQRVEADLHGDVDVALLELLELGGGVGDLLDGDLGKLGASPQ